ncbi:hypothetical protein [Paenibacillus sp. FSL R7-269]|uniref:hypothetical protein n=1 Tax=Paenibacillus sp. FSL R7-269 TaxID=1226755 RepID=UPI000566CD8D|nr:hypothetical protein [Paenibacillus sp. FSL R7-269]
MSKLEKLFVSYSVPRVVITHKKTGTKEILYAVSSNGDTAIIGKIGEQSSDWINHCREVSKIEIINEYYLC